MTSIDVRVILAGTILCCATYSTAFAQEFGKVFSTPQERAFLDRQREEMLQELDEQERLAVLSQPVEAQGELELAPRLVHMGGVVRKPDGNHTVWLNGVAVGSQDLPSNVSLVFEQGMGMLRINTADGVHTVRPGQTLDADTGGVREDYELTDAEIETVRAAVALRDAQADERRSNSRASTNNASTNAATSIGETDEQVNDAAEMINNVVEILQLMQEARDVEGALQ